MTRSLLASPVRGLAVLLALTVGAGANVSAAPPPPPPNIVLIISDDHGWTDYGFMGHRQLQTPRLDKLAAQSLTFRRGYVPSSLCCPSLASIITGRYPHQHKITCNDPPLPLGPKPRPGEFQRSEAFRQGRETMSRHLEAVPTLPRLLADRGYVSLQTGKWWQGDFRRGGFTDGMTRGARHGDDGLKIGRETMTPAFDFIDKAQKENKPFFVWYAPMMPHDPHTPPQRLLEKYRKLTPSIHIARYWAMVEWFDETCGQLLDHLDQRKLADNTIVIYVTDNGWTQSPDKGGPIRSKTTPYDAGLRTPIMIRWPGKVQPRQTDDLAMSIDIAPTLLAAIGAKPVAAMTGVNLLDDRAVQGRKAIQGACFTHNAVDLNDPARNVLWRWAIDGRWKLIAPRDPKQSRELYDLIADPAETRDLAAAEPATVDRLSAQLDRWWDPGPNPDAKAEEPAQKAKPTIDLTGHDPSSGIKIEADRSLNLVRAEWSEGDERFAAEFAIDGERPLIRSLTVNGKTLIRDVQPIWKLTAGVRVQRPGVKYIFFDRPFAAKNGPVSHHRSRLELKSVKAVSTGKRAELRFGTIASGPFSGDLTVKFYDGSPLLHWQAEMTPQAENLAYCYEAWFEGDFASFAWKDVQDQFIKRRIDGPPQPLQVRGRTIIAETDSGSIALFPHPHTYMFPRDHSTNFGFVQAGRGRIGLRDAHDDPAPFVPWIDAPIGKAQRMGAFLLLSSQPAEQAFERAQAYTRGDTFKPIAGRTVMTSHWHARLTVSEAAGRASAAEFKKVMRRMGVDLVHLAEFHGDGHPRDVGQVRLNELKGMFDLCRKYSDERFLLMPGEEANAFIPGHWLYLFPKPVYLTLAPKPGAPFAETIEPYGQVYHPSNETEMAKVLEQEKALAWTAHPRIKSSESFPDGYRDKPWYQNGLWLGATWKAMPADLSEIRLGTRCLDLLDDMNAWGQRKYVIGEVDTFEVDSTHENYGHMNANYLRLPKVPSFDDWSPVLDVLRRGDFFVTTGEPLIHSCQVVGDKIQADLEWTFPLEEAVLVVYDGRSTQRRRVRLPETMQFGRRSFEWPLGLSENAANDGADERGRWFRIEIWDAAGDGAFTQPIPL